jgi:hypothetical protein
MATSRVASSSPGGRRLASPAAATRLRRSAWVRRSRASESNEASAGVLDGGLEVVSKTEKGEELAPW